MTHKTVYSIDLLRPLLPDLLSGTRPQLLVNLIKDDPGLASRVVQGFRISPPTIRLPPVRQRLIREIERSEDLLDSIVTAWVECNDVLWKRMALSTVDDLRESISSLSMEYGTAPVQIALLVDDRAEVRGLSDSVQAASIDAPEVDENDEKSKVDSVLRRVDDLASEKRQLRARVRELEKASKDFDSQLEDLRQKLVASEAELERRGAELMGCRAQLARAEKVSDRLRRANQAVEQEKSIVKRELRQVQKEVQVLEPPISVSIPSLEEIPTDSGDWIRVVSQLSRSGNDAAALAFCEAFLEVNPESLKVHLALERIYARSQASSKQVDECLWISARMLNLTQPVRACAFACRALGVEPTRHAAQVQLRNVLASIDIANESLIAGARRLLGRLRISNALAYRQAHKIIKNMGRKYLHAYEGTHDILDIDKTFALTDGDRSIQTSARRILNAVNTNEVALAEFLRRGISNLKRTRPTLYRSLLRTLEKSDTDCKAALTATRGPVVLDGSNVAWHDSTERAVLQSIIRVQKDLWREGFFPVHIYVDASLPHQIDNEPSLRALIDSGAVVVAESGTDADEAIVRLARSLSCPVVTNDRMTDWDPADEVPKLRFSIDSFGTTIYAG